MNIENYLNNLGYVTPSDSESLLLEEHLHSLDHKEYTVKLENMSFIIGIYSNSYIHYIESLNQREGWYDSCPHSIPKATPLAMDELILTAYFDEDINQNKDSILDHLGGLGWDIRFPLKDSIDINFDFKEYFLEFNGFYYSVWIKESDTIYLIYSISTVNPNIKKEEILKKLLPSVQKVIDIKIENLNKKREELSKKIDK